MPKHSFTLGENRTIFVTLDELNAQRAKVGASPVVAPYNTRTAEANASQQVAQRQAQLELNQSTGQTVGAGMQIAPTTPINTQLANAQTTYKNSALGLQSGITNTLQDGQQVSSPVSLVGKDSFQQGAIDRMRERGMSDEQIRTQLDEVAPQLQSTMSNTGLGGTFDQKGMFVPKTIAEAQNVLATSRNPQEKAQAQKVIDDQLNEVKGYAPRTNVDPATGATWVTYSEDAGATAKAREEAKNRMAIEEQNRLNLQKLKEDAKKKVALMVPNDIKETSDKVLQLKAVLDQLSPELRAAGSLEIQQMLDGQDRISKATQQALDTFSTDTEIEDSYQGTEDRIKQVEKLFIQFADDSKATAERVANYNRDMLLIDKKIMESKNAEDETKQIQANIKNERKLRRQLAALNITTDLQGLQYLDDAIQEGQSTLASLRNANSLNLLKAQLAIGEGYAIDMQKAMDNQRASYLDITTKTTDALEAVRKSISLDKKDRNKEIRSILTKDAEDKNKLETEIAKGLRELAKETLSSVDRARDDKFKQEQLGWQIWNNAYDNYKGNVPKSILEQVKRYIPDFDVNGAMKKGGTGTGFSLGQVISGSNSYSGMTKSQALEAIKRVFSPNTYGGTASERAGKVNEYMSRLSSGENVGSVMQSAVTDYWSSYKGTGKNEHDQRVVAQSSAEALQSYIDFYGISQENEGLSLGYIDSKLQYLGSWLGLSSEEYNNLASQVGSLRAKMIKENYGSAVTPQELSLARSYIPEMSDKAGTFVTKLANLKQQQKYLDDKVTAVNLGLPIPKPPTPIQYKGERLTGTAKFSNDDILNTIK